MVKPDLTTVQARSDTSCRQQKGEFTDKSIDRIVAQAATKTPTVEQTDTSQLSPVTGRSSHSSPSPPEAMTPGLNISVGSSNQASDSTEAQKIHSSSVVNIDAGGKSAQKKMFANFLTAFHLMQQSVVAGADFAAIRTELEALAETMADEASATVAVGSANVGDLDGIAPSSTVEHLSASPGSSLKPHEEMLQHDEDSTDPIAPDESKPRASPDVEPSQANGEIVASPADSGNKTTVAEAPSDPVMNAKILRPLSATDPTAKIDKSFTTLPNPQPSSAWWTGESKRGKCKLHPEMPHDDAGCLVQQRQARVEHKAGSCSKHPWATDHDSSTCKFLLRISSAQAKPLGFTEEGDDSKVHLPGTPPDTPLLDSTNRQSATSPSKPPVAKSDGSTTPKAVASHGVSTPKTVGASGLGTENAKSEAHSPSSPGLSPLAPPFSPFRDAFPIMYEAPRDPYINGAAHLNHGSGLTSDAMHRPYSISDLRLPNAGSMPPINFRGSPTHERYNPQLHPYNSSTGFSGIGPKSPTAQVLPHAFQPLTTVQDDPGPVYPFMFRVLQRRWPYNDKELIDFSRVWKGDVPTKKLGVRSHHAPASMENPSPICIHKLIDQLTWSLAQESYGACHCQVAGAQRARAMKRSDSVGSGSDIMMPSESTGKENAKASHGSMSSRDAGRAMSGSSKHLRNTSLNSMAHFANLR